MERLKGTAIAPGLAVGRAVLLTRRGRALRFPVAPERVERELARLQAARERSRTQIRGIRERISHGPGADLAPIFDAQLLMLDDPLLVDRAVALVREQLVNAEWAVQQAFDELEAVFDGVGDPYLHERKGDVADVSGRLRMNLAGGTGGVQAVLRQIDGPLVLIADELPPSVAGQVDWSRVTGLALDAGTRTSHTAILARSFQVPAVVGLRNATRHARPGDLVAVDGTAGELLCRPAEDLIARLRRRESESAARDVAPAAAPGPVETADGVRIAIRANLDLPDDLAAAREAGAEGVGLCRSEFLLVAAGAGAVAAVDEDRQFEIYRQIVEAMAPHPVTIRTLDLEDADLDPQLDDRDAESRRAAGARRPMGVRGIRLSLARPELFRRQIRAILRAAPAGDVRLLMPFVSTIGEVRAARAIVADVAAELAAAGIAVPRVPVGAMIEVPLAALTADALAREVDFLAIGTNDLAQYALAADRTDERVAALNDPVHPGLVRLVRLVRALTSRSGVPVSVCGEMASDPVLLALLIGLGYREFSMTPGAIHAAQAVVRAARLPDLRRLARATIRDNNTAALEAWLRQSLGDEREVVA